MKRRRGSWRPPKRRGSRSSLLHTFFPSSTPVQGKNRSILSPMSRFEAISSTVGISSMNSDGSRRGKKRMPLKSGSPTRRGGSCPRTTSTGAIRTSRSSFPTRWAGRAEGSAPTASGCTISKRGGSTSSLRSSDRRGAGRNSSRKTWSTSETIRTSGTS